MIVKTSTNQGVEKLIRLTLDSSATRYSGYVFEEQSGYQGIIRGLKYDKMESSYYYLTLPEYGNHSLIRYDFSSNKKTVVYKRKNIINGRIWISDDNNIIVLQDGTLIDLRTGEVIYLRPDDSTPYVASASNGLETILIKRFPSLTTGVIDRVISDRVQTTIESKVTPENLLYPNPTSDLINITLRNQNSNFFECKIIDLNHRTIFNKDLGFLESGENFITVQVDMVPSGFYLVEISSSKEIIYTYFLKK